VEREIPEEQEILGIRVLVPLAVRAESQPPAVVIGMKVRMFVGDEEALGHQVIQPMGLVEILVIRVLLEIQEQVHLH